MTTPHERTRSIVQAREFLQALRGSEEVPESVRNEAHRLLRHFTASTSMLGAGTWVRQTGGFIGNAWVIFLVGTLHEGSASLLDFQLCKWRRN
jgi:hypothetical protein